MSDDQGALTGAVTGYASGAKVQLYDNTTYLGDATIGSTISGVTSWIYTPGTLAAGSHTLKALYVNTAGASNSANQATLAFTETATDTTFSAIAATDPVSGLTVKSFSLAGAGQTLNLLDFANTEIDVVNLAGTGANTVKLGLADVLLNGANLFNSGNGWSALVGTGKQQLVVNGGADDTLVVDSTAQAGAWQYAGTTTHTDATTSTSQTYLIYNHLDGVAQLLIDSDIARQGAVL